MDGDVLLERPRRSLPRAVGQFLVALFTAAVCGLSVASAPAAALTNVAVTPNDKSPWNQPSLARDPVRAGRLAVAYELGSMYASPVCEIGLSSDNGRSWKNVALVGSRGAVRFRIPRGDRVCDNPQLAYGPGGELYYVFSTIPKPPPGGGNKTFVYFMRSLDGGRTFTAPRLVARPSATRDRVGDFYPVIAAAPSGRWVYVAFTRTDSTGVNSDTYVASSSNRGRTFSRPVRVSRQTTTESGTIAVGSDGTVYLGFNDLTSTYVGCGTQPPTFTCPSVIYAARSFDHGRSFSSARIASVNAGCPGPDVELRFGLPKAFCTPLHSNGYAFYSPQVVPGASRGSLYAVWWGGDPQTPARVFFSRSRNGGRTWTSPQSFPGGAGGHEQYLPEMSVAPNGRIDVIYYDHVYYDRGAGNGYENVLWTHSSDGGRRFSAPLKLTTRSSNTSIGPPEPFGPGTSFGNFLGLASTDNELFAAWTDSRRGHRGTSKQDVFFAGVRAK